MTVLTVILAGGQARRMGGGDKALLRLGSQTLLEHVITTLAPQTDALALSIRGDPEKWHFTGLPLIDDRQFTSEGPLAGMVAALTSAKATGHTKLLTAPCDTPFLPDDLTAKLRSTQAAAKTPITIAASQSIGGERRSHPTIALFDLSAEQTIERLFLAGERKLMAAFQGSHVSQKVWEYTTTDPFFNINRPQDLADARALMGV